MIDTSRNGGPPAGPPKHTTAPPKHTTAPPKHTTAPPKHTTGPTYACWRSIDQTPSWSEVH